MSRARKLIREIHRRSMWQVLGIYVAGAWGVLQAVEMFTEVAGLPGWVLPFAIVLLLIGLPVVVATAFLQEGMPHGEAAEVPRKPDPARAAPAVRGPVGSDVERLLTWRNVIAGGIVAFALWGVAALGWLLFADTSAGSSESGDPADVGPALVGAGRAADSAAAAAPPLAPPESTRA
ncbi:MAG: hypothetical protein ACRELC_10435, partial [Gemmatimonadota bacterium]